MNEEAVVHYLKSAGKLPGPWKTAPVVYATACGKDWKAGADIPGKVTCPACLADIKKEGAK